MDDLCPSIKTKMKNNIQIVRTHKKDQSTIWSVKLKSVQRVEAMNTTIRPVC